MKFIYFESIERYLVLYLDSRYDLILGMAWLERHEHWINWKSKTIGGTRKVLAKLWRVMKLLPLETKALLERAIG